MTSTTIPETSNESLATSAAFGASTSLDPARVESELSRWFPERFVLLDTSADQTLGQTPSFVSLPNWPWWRELSRAAARSRAPALIEEAGPVGLLAVPLPFPSYDLWVAIIAVALRRPEAGESLHAAARILGLEVPAALAWLERQEDTTPAAVLRHARLFMAKFESDCLRLDLQNEADALALHLSSATEEISLLYRLTQNLKLTKRKDEFGRMALEWLGEVLPARSLAIQLATRIDSGDENRAAGLEPLWLTQGPCPISCAEFSRLVAGLELTRETHAVVLNGGDDSQSLPRAVRQIIITPLCEGQNLFGWLAAINHVDDAHFGALEANLLNSVAAILGIHNGNIELYRQQGDLLAGVVRALTSAIDAKDPYTCGHSDRVANVAVQIGRELAFDKEQLSTLYLSGLLHDIGKIGIDDRVLRKPDKLTPEEFEHIKTHTVIGHRILKDLKQLDQVLPVVLHHHENWDGAGYPSQLAGDQIPLMARIVAVADAFDAMSSNRSYRPGISRERIFEIFRAGSDRQWDLRIVEAFFRAQTDAGERAGEIDDVAPLTPAHAGADDLGSLGDNAHHEPTSQRNS